MGDLQKISPEVFSTLECYINNNFSADATCASLKIPKDELFEVLDSKEAKNYLNVLFQEFGYLNRFKFFSLMDEMIESKIQEARETEFYSKKDLLEIMEKYHKMKMEELKLLADSSNGSPHTAVQVNNNIGSLLDKVLGDK